jgi:tetratricopeptide (TPR) repeat protein
MFRVRKLWCLAVLLAVSPLVWADNAATIWEDAPFSADAAAVLRAAAAAPPDDGTGAVILFEEGVLTFDASGRRSFRYRVVYKVVSASAVSGWSTIERQWAPWHQERPELRARVVAGDGSVHTLDPKTIAESPAREASDDLFTDSRILSAPLPAVAAGSVVEEEILTRETAPLFDAGETGAFFFGSNVPMARVRLILDFPQELSLRYVSRFGAPAPVRSEEDGRVHLVFEAGPLPAPPERETGAPWESSAVARVEFSTGRSWQRVAEGYAAIVDAQIAGARFPPLPLERRGPAETAAAALARLQGDVRYTGIEFSEASIVPRTPAETLKRKYGDCKDKAALLVAMLRAAGLSAHVALLKAGPGTDVAEDLPGLGSFDHAIVHVEGPTPLWIDPTDEFARAGELPVADQGRLALIASAGAAGLVRTPESTAQDNRSVETREFFLAERGRARVVETTEAWGSIERGYRRNFRDANPKALREGLEKYAGREYLAKGAVETEHSNPNDLSRPFQIRIEAADAGRGATDQGTAVAAIRLESLLQRLPAELTQATPASAGTPGTEKAKEKKRTQDYVFFEPFSVEWRYRIVPPPGYDPAPLPESGVLSMGPARLTRHYAAAADGTVTATLRFESGKRRITPAEFGELREGVRTLLESEPILIRFEQTGERLLAAGRIRESLEEFRRLAALHPKEALHHSQLALALLRAGLGEAARGEARRAIAVEPSSALADRTLGWVLEHDALGRRFHRGFDRAGAIAAYRKSKELDSSDAVTRGDLAILLEHDDRGVRYSPHADLPGATAEYRALRDDLGEKSLDQNLLVALMWSGQFRSMLELARSLGPSDTKNQFIVLGTALTEDVPAAIREAGRLVTDAAQRCKVLESVGATLGQLRLYPQAAAVTREAAAGAENPAELRSRAELFARLKRHEEMTLPESEPQTVARKLLLAFFSEDPSDPRVFHSLLANGIWSAIVAEDPQRGLSDEVETLRAQFQKQNIPLAFLADASLGGVEFVTDGSDALGYRLRMTTAFGTGDMPRSQLVFVTREKDGYRIVAFDQAITPVGAEALRRLDRRDVAGARQWLDWAREEIVAAGGDDPLAGHPFADLWKKGQDGGEREIRIAAASLLATTAGLAERALPILEAGRSSAPSEQERTTIDWAIALADRTLKRYRELSDVALRLRARFADSDTAFGLLQFADWQLGRLDQAEQDAKAYRTQRPDDPAATRALASLAAARGDIEAAIGYDRELVDRGRAESVDYNNLAWNSLFLEPLSREAVRQAERAVAMSQRKDPASLHTLASIYAETGRPVEARDALLEALDLTPGGEPNSAQWYVLGRIAELYGEKNAAVEAYQKVVKPDLAALLPNSTYRLAQRRLELMESPGNAPHPTAP